MPNELYQKPKLVLRGVDFESILSASPEHTINPENELKEFAQEYAGGVINLNALPYTQNRQNSITNLVCELTDAFMA
ncbi:MAG: hypothetical protein IPH22_12200 [Nitrosomonas sp.]|nr:hypothetical protein [Nitrosomonas sp.]